MAKDFKLGKPKPLCTACGKELVQGENFVAIARFGEEELIREDYHMACWVEPLDPEESLNSNILGVWQTRLPEEEEKKNKRLLVDDDLLINFFTRLEGQEQEDRINFRFVLALILMRKKLLDYVSSSTVEDVDIWRMKFKKDTEDNIHEVIDPGMDDDKIASVSASLSEVMEGDFED